MKNHPLLCLGITLGLLACVAVTDVHGQSFSWDQRANMPSGRWGASTFVLGDKAYVVGGRIGGTDKTEMWCYDLDSDTWSAKAPIPIPRRLAASFAINGKGYVTCGANGSTYLNDLWQYDPVLDTWSQKAPLPGLARYGPFAFAIGGSGYVGTGNRGSASGPMLADAWKYDQASNSWSATPALPDLARFGTSSFEMNGIGYVFGGKESNLVFTTDLWSFDPTTQAWSLHAPFPGSPRSSPMAFVHYNTFVIGCGRNDSQNFYDVWQYDPTGNAWTQAPAYPGESSLAGTSFSIQNRAFGGLGWRLDDNTSRSDLWELAKPDISGINDLNGSKYDVQVYPVPCSNSGSVTIRTESSDLVHAQLVNMQGAQLMHWDFRNECQIDLRNTPAGSYLISWRFARSTGTKLLIVQ